MKMQGVWTAVVTPFDRNDIINEKTLALLLKRQYDAGVDGIVMLGTTGEAATLEDQERDFVIKLAVRELKGKLPVMIGCGSPSTKKTVQMAVRAEELGADSLQVVTPFYNRPTQEGIYYHFKAVSDAVSIPICVYNIPGRTGQNIETSTLCRIAELPNIISVKEASGSISQAQDVIEQIAHKRSNFTLITGDDIMTLPTMAIGGHGVMSVVSNLVPRAVKQLTEHMQQGNLALARALHYALKPLILGCFVETNPIPIKRMLQLAGFDVGACRLPLCQPTKANDEKIVHTFEACRHLIDEELKPIALSPIYQEFE